MGAHTRLTWWKRRLLEIVEARLDWVRQRLSDRPLPLKGRYPDYVTCPHCGTPEVEAWSDAPAACCHECGQRFPYPPPGAAD
jgi:hypothetical protein